jgi:AraC-like DNA-binding protein
VDFHPVGVPGLEYVGHDCHSEPLGLHDHAHRGTEICYLASGEVTWMVGRRPMRLVGGTISVIGPGTSHRGELDVIAPSDLYWVVFSSGALRPKLGRELVRALTGRPYSAPAPPLVKDLFDGILAECGARGPGWAAAAGAQLTGLAVACARLSGTGGTSGRAVPGPVGQAARILAEQLESPPSMRELSRAVGLGPTRFHALFKGSIGLTPRDYLRRQRLERAREALAGGAEDITALAIRLGFPSSQQFATTFKRYTGLTPSAFRRAARRERP